MEFQEIQTPNLPKHVNIGILNIKNSYNACWIIDGQHRLYSFARSNSNEMIPCIAFDNISLEDERGFFIAINKKQKPIQPDLLWDLEGKAHPDTPEGKISNIVRKLNFREPFRDKIYIPVYGSKSGKSINMAAFCNGILNSKITSQITSNCVGRYNPLFTDDPWTAVNRISSVLERYFKLIDDNFSDDHKNYIFGNAGIPVMLYILEPIVSRLERIPSSEDLKKYVDCIQKFFDENYTNKEQLRKLRLETNSEGSRKNLAKQIGIFIRKSTKDKNFWPKMEELDFVREIIEMERRIGRLISQKLSSLTTGWEKQRIPESIYKNAKKKMESDGTEFHENFDLGEEFEIIKRSDNWSDTFQRVFVSKDGFVDSDELRIAFFYLSKIRNPASHGKSFVPTKEDFDQCDIYLQKFSKVVPETISEEDSEQTDLPA